MLHVITVRFEDEADADKLRDLLGEWEEGSTGRMSGYTGAGQPQYSAVEEPESGFSVTSSEEGRE